MVGRGLFLTQDAKHADVVVLERQALGQDTYFFLLSGDGSLAKVAYAQVTSTSWQLMGNTVSGPTFEKEKSAWQKQLAKLGAPAAPAAAAGDEKKGAAAHSYGISRQAASMACSHSLSLYRNCIYVVAWCVHAHARSTPAVPIGCFSN